MSSKPYKTSLKVSQPHSWFNYIDLKRRKRSFLFHLINKIYIYTCITTKKIIADLPHDA